MTEKYRVESPLVSTTFTTQFALSRYEGFTPLYQACARNVIARDANPEAARAGVEIGCGTGISTLVILENYQGLVKLIGIEPSRGFLEVAKYKFGHHANLPTRSITISDEILHILEDQRVRALPFASIVHFKRGRAEKLPVKDEVADRVFSCQSFHWYTFADNDFGGKDRSHLDISTAQIARILKKGGLFLFDTSGLQFDFGADRENGRLVNDYHLLGHPLHRAFLDQVNEIFLKRGYNSNALVDLKRTDRYYHIFDIEFLAEALSRAGLTLVPTEQGSLYTRVFDLRSKESFINIIKSAAPMRCFNSISLQMLSTQEKDEIIDEAFKKAGGEDSKLLDQSAYEITVQFAAKKVI